MKSGNFLMWVALATIAAAVIFLYHIQGTHTTEEDNGVVAFASFQQVLQQSNAGKSISSQVSPKEKALQEELETKKKEFQLLADDLNKKHKFLSKAEYDEKGKNLQQMITNFNNNIQKRHAAINIAAKATVEKVHQVMQQELATMAEEYHFSSILPAEQALYMDKKLDVTSEVIRRLDKTLSNVDLHVEEK